MTAEGKKDFDKEADAWDENPARVKLANDVADAIITQARPNRGMDVLDFGCGTGAGHAPAPAARENNYRGGQLAGHACRSQG